MFDTNVQSIFIWNRRVRILELLGFARFSSVAGVHKEMISLLLNPDVKFEYLANIVNSNAQMMVQAPVELEWYDSCFQTLNTMSKTIFEQQSYF